MLRAPTADRLEFPRTEGHHPLRAVAYRLDRAAVRALGRPRTLSGLCRLARLSNRLALELAADVYGDELLDTSAVALDRDALAAAIPEGGSVVDVGCAYGRWSRWLAERAGRVIGVDLDADAITRARKMTTAANVEYRVGDVRDVIAAGEVFDVALLMHILEHIDDPTGFLRALHPVARAVAVEVPDFESDPLNFVRLTLGQPFSSDADHVREYTEQTLRDALADAGWHVQWLAKRAGRIAAIASEHL